MIVYNWRKKHIGANLIQSHERTVTMKNQYFKIELILEFSNNC